MTEIREHEEFTKVKNIERIELGRYEMETWYFSPFPPELAQCKVPPPSPPQLLPLPGHVVHWHSCRACDSDHCLAHCSATSRHSRHGIARAMNTSSPARLKQVCHPRLPGRRNIACYHETAKAVYLAAPLDCEGTRCPPSRATPTIALATSLVCGSSRRLHRHFRLERTLAHHRSCAAQPAPAPVLARSTQHPEHHHASVHHVPMHAACATVEVCARHPPRRPPAPHPVPCRSRVPRAVRRVCL